ncbi:MAG: hypothetical protein U0L61_01240 [Alistipes sp.]|jgi:phosphoglycolate phosphatase|nr:hypothetical protein [Alistipes sp.]
MARVKDLFMSALAAVKRFLGRLSFRTGVIVLASCVVFYLLSFAQMLLPISAAAKGVLWFVLFGMAKTTQYAGLAIVGVEGWKRLKAYFKRS